MTSLALFLLFLQAAPDVQEHLKKGYEFGRSGKLEAAEAEAREAVKLAPRDAVPLAFLGMVLSSRGKLAEADQAFDRALAIDPTDARTRYNLAVNQFRLGDAAKAKGHLEQVLQANPANRAAALMLAQCYQRTREPEKARATLRGLLADAEGQETVLRGAKGAAYAGDFDGAEWLLRELEPVHPEKAKIGYELALVQYNAGRFAASEATLERAFAGGAREAALVRLLAWSRQRQKRPAEAVETMLEAIRLEPARETGYEQLAQILLEQKRYRDAYEAAKKATEIAPRSATAYRLKGQAEMPLRNVRPALESLSRAVELNAQDQEALLLLGQAQRDLWMVREASATYEKGIAKFPRNARFYEGYGRLLVDPGAKPDAAAKARARGLLEKALALDGSLAEAQYELGKLLLGAGDAKAALPHLEAAAKLKPESSKVYFTLAGAYRDLDRDEEYRKALAAYKRLAAAEGE